MHELSQQLRDAIKTLHEGGVVAHPTETCYGLAADIFQKKALDRLYALKQMSFEKPVSVLVRDLDEAQRYGEFSAAALKLALQYWPGPLTIIVPRKSTVPAYLNFGHPTIGFRVSSNKKTRELVEAFGGPLTTTSANVTTLPQAYSVQEMLDQKLVPDFVLDGGRIGENPPSTIVEVLDEELKVIRQGSIKL
jgi:L-threonylcarbamoyladenylate synthase